MQQTLLGGTRYGNAQENAVSKGVAGKAMAGKPRLTSAGARAALGNISNKVQTNTNVDGKKVKELAKPMTRAFTKSQATSSLHSIMDKENTSREITKVCIDYYTNCIKKKNLY